MAEGITVRPLESLDDATAASELFDRIWGERRVMGAPLLRAMASHGGQVLGAFDGDRMVGAQVGVVGIVDGKPALHSHITGVAEEAQHRGVGFLLKVAQREWCLERGIDRVTWTFDPMVARNGYFNLKKLGAVADRFHRDYYGEMRDAFNAGDRSDRLEVTWELGSERVHRAIGGRDHADEDQSEDAPPGFLSFFPLLVADVGDGPHSGAALDPGSTTAGIAVPRDYHALRTEDPERAGRWRDAVADAFEAAFAAGYRAVGFVPRMGYLLERST